MQYRILGRLEAVRDGAPLPLGGFQQRALLAMLLIARGRTVSLDRLVDELWPEQPPKAAIRTVRVYISQLRKLLGEDEVETRERGYGLRLGPDALDADRFGRLVDDARSSAAAGDATTARTQLQGALDLWHGAALAEFAPAGFAASEAARLEELRVGAVEDLVDIQLSEGASAALIPRLEELRASNPLRERVTAQLMTALYRAGRQADALAAYEGTRLALDELGLQPGEELRRLQRQILQHDGALDEASPQPPPTTAMRAGTPRRWWLLIAGLAAAVVAAAALASSPGDKGSSVQTDTRSRPITLVLGGRPPKAQTAPDDLQDTIASDDLNGLRSAARAYGARVRVAYGNYNANLTRAAARSSVVLLGPGFDDLGELAAVTRAHPRTVYVLIGGSIHDAPFGPNVVGMTFDDHEVGYLGGYLSALMARRGHPSAVAGLPTPEVVKIVRGFEAGVRAAAPRMWTQVSYAGTFVDQPVCEHVANRQIDGGSTVVFDIAGTCGFGAIDAAGVRGVNAVGIDTDLTSLGPQVIGSVVKRFDSAVELSVQLAVHHDLRAGRDTVLNLGNDGVDAVSLGSQVPAGVRTKLERVITALRARDVAANRTGT